MSSSVSIRTVLEKMNNTDSDYRYMATSDLLSELQNSSLKADHETQKKLCRALLKLMKDTNSEVQAMAMKCLPHLAAFVDIQNTILLVDKLLDYVLNKNSPESRSSAHDVVSVKAVRDVSAVALKSVLSKVDPSGHQAMTLAPLVVPRLIDTIATKKAVGEDADVLIETLELLHEILTRMGSFIVNLHIPLAKTLFIQLDSTNPLVRKRTISSLGSLGAACDNILFGKIVDKVLADLQNPPSHEAVQTGVQVIRALSKSSGHRLGAHLPTLAPILFDLISEQKTHEDDDLRENCLQALESFCLRCRREMVPFADTLVRCVVRLAKYDPNYVLDDEDNDDASDDEEEQMTGEHDMDEEYDDEDYSDDDDSSWKVRRAAIKCLHAAITSHLLPPDQVCRQFGLFLVTRFREREEQVKLDVFAAFIDLLRLCSRQSSMGLPSKGLIGANPSAFDSMTVDSGGMCADMEPLMSRVPHINRSLKRELGAKSSKTRIRTMTVMRELVLAMPSIAHPLVNKVIMEIGLGLTDPATSMKTETLLFLRVVVNRGGMNAIKDHVDVLIPRVLAAADDRYYKVTTECLKFCGAALLAFGSAPPDSKVKLTAHAVALFEAALSRATAQDQDSEVKEAALHCLGGIVSRFGQELGPQRLTDVSEVLKDRLGKEVTRLATVRAMHLIAISESAEVLIPVMSDVAATLSGLLRKNNQSLRTAALELLCAAPVLPAETHHDLVANVSDIISDTDLRLSALALKLARKLIVSQGRQLSAQISAPNSIYVKSLQLSTSPLLQGRAISSLLGLFRSLADINAEPLTIQKMLEDLKECTSSVGFNVSSSASKSAALYCIAKCVVVVCDAAEPTLRAEIAQQIVSNVTSEDFKTRIFSLACLGEFGRSSILSREGNEKNSVRSAILSALDASQEEVKIAAALSLGGLSSADNASGLPFLIGLLKDRPNQRYLLLLALKETISSSEAKDMTPLVPDLLSVVFDHPVIRSDTANSQYETSSQQRSKASEEESVRTATAECLGLLTQTSPDVLKSLSEGTSSESANVRALVTAAVKFAVSTSSQTHSALIPSLSSSLGTFIHLIGDEDVTVAKQAIQALNSAAKSKPELLIPHLSSALPLIYARTAKDKNLVRVVDLGPFKHEEDFGLDLRKSAFDCLRTLVSGSLCSSIPIPTMLEHVAMGLRDQPDVRSIAQLILAIAASRESAPQIVHVLDPIVRALEETFNERLKENAVRQEVERHEDSIRGALRAVRMMEAVPEISSHRNFQTLMTNIVRAKFSEKYETIGKSEVEMLTFGGATGVDSGLMNGKDDEAMAD